MKLRSRLALVSILMLCLPLAGWQLVRSLEQALRDSYQQALVDTARSIASEISSAAGDLPRAGALYVHETGEDIVIDGYAGDWASWLEETQAIPARTGDAESADLLAAEQGGRLHLLVRVRDPELVLSRPGGQSGDRIELGIGDGNPPVTVAPLAPGWFDVQGNGGTPRIQAALQPGELGWTMELAVERPRDVAALDIRVFDVDTRDGKQAEATHAFPSPRPLARPSEALSQRLTALLPEGTRGWVTTTDGWILARAARGQDELDAQSATVPDEDEGWLFATAAARLLGILPDTSPDRGAERDRLDDGERQAKPSAGWYQLPAGNGFVVSAGAPVVRDSAPAGHVVIERPADRFMASAYRSLLQLFLFGLAGMLIVAAVPIGFAARISARIRRLRDAAESSVGADGRVHGTMPGVRGSDEIADLGRSLSGMVERQRQHQQYLQTLAGKLSHELRTPLAMIRTSLDNLAEVGDEESRERYRQRAAAGCFRLQHMFQSMSQAARIEESLSEEPLVGLDFGKLVADYVSGCRQAFTGHRFAAVVPNRGTARIAGAAEQLAQLLDKLVENAVAFSPADSRITIRVVPQGGDVSLQVDNPGSSLPDDQPERLFESMVSSRKSGGDGVHLGLGLHIVRLIAQRHGGRVRALDRPDGVRFQVDFPRLAD
ncbi:ATP-binding protein [Wenzhouxiangella sediminis]|uniref:histidine kinase n=1 Tax=Wenzhouxiangella sediminis TaxID=1792836 RepID=A0A3E1KCC6_9GAMM|nr:ATP-binding protein [Wenzhouxiangella sediminis]RFF32412.1 HAMP domain-containing protein [Wenzhouxiangella sediminis]